MSTAVRRALTALIVLLLGVGVVSAAVVDGDDEPDRDRVAGGPEATTTTAPPLTTTAPPATTTTAAPPGAPTTTAPGSGLGMDGSGEVAAGPGQIADTGTEDVVIPSAFALGVALVLRRARRAAGPA